MDPEGRSGPRFAFHRYITPKHGAKALRDGQAQSGATIFPCRRRVGLGKIDKQPVELFRGHADTGIGNRDFDGIVRLQRDGDADGAVFGELAGIAEQVEDHLADAGDIGMHGRQDRRQVHLDLVVVGGRQRLRHVDAVADQGGEVERLDMNFHLAGFDFREIEDVVDQFQQMLAGAADPLQRLDHHFVAVLDRVFLQHLGDADNGIERGAKLVAHIGEKLALGFGRLHGDVARFGEAVDHLPQLDLAGLGVGDIGEDPNDAAFPVFCSLIRSQRPSAR